MVVISTDTNWRSVGAAPHATPQSPWPRAANGDYGHAVLQAKRLVATERAGRQGPAEPHNTRMPQNVPPTWAYEPRAANVQRTQAEPGEPLSPRFFENLQSGPRRLGQTPRERTFGSPPACPPESGWSSLASSPRVAPLSARAPRAGESGAQQPSDRPSETPGGAPMVELAFRSTSSRRASHTPLAARRSHPECSRRPSHAPPELDHGAAPSDEEAPLNLLADVQWILFPRATDKPAESELLETEAPGLPGNEELLLTLRKTPLLACLSDAALSALLRAGRVWHYPRYSSLGREGTRSAVLAVVLQGQVGVLSTHPEFSVAMEGRGASFWHGAIVTDVVRDCSVGAWTECRVLTISRDELAGCAEAELLMRSVGGMSLRRQVVLDALSTRPFFGDQPPNKLDTLQPFLHPQHFAAGDTFYKEGDIGGIFYLLLHGRVQVSVQVSTINDYGREVLTSKALHTYSEASEMPWFGELAVWLNKPQGGTATALTHTCCLALRREDFERFNTLMPEFRGSLTKKAKFWKAITGQHLKDGGQHTEAQLLQTRTAASVALRSGGGLGASKLVGGPAGGKQKVLARAATAERWETLLLGMMLNGEKPRADAHTFVPSMSLGVDAYTFKKPPPRKSSFEHAAPLVRMPSFEEQPSKTSWNSSPR